AWRRGRGGGPVRPAAGPGAGGGAGAPARCPAGVGAPAAAPPPAAPPRHERRLDAEIAERYGTGRTLADVSQAWRPYRTWAAVHLRALREQRTREGADRRALPPAPDSQ